MSYGRAMSFWRVSVQIVALFVASWNVRAQSVTAGEARSQHGSATFVAGFSRSPVAESNIESRATPTSAANDPFAGVSGVGVGLTMSASSGSQGFSYNSPNDTFGIFIQSTGSVTNGNDLFSPFGEILRSSILGHAIPGAGTLNTSGANHFETSVSPHWILCRNSRYPITITLPVQVVAADDPYWLGHHYGWVAGGMNIRVPLAFLPRQCGKWTAGTSADLCYYGTTTTEFAQSVGILQMPKLAAAIGLSF